MRLVICAIVKDEPDLDEWLDFHLNEGVDRIDLYDNGGSLSCRRPGVSVHSFPGQYAGIQLDAYHHWLANRHADADWCAFIDADEFLFAPEGLKAAIEKASSCARSASAIAVNWKLFGSSGIKARPPSVVQSYIHRASDGTRDNMHVKLIARPRADGIFRDAHHMDRPAIACGSSRRVTGLFSVPEPDAPMRIHHYCIKSAEDMVLRTFRGAVDQVQRDIGVLRRMDSICTVLDTSLRDHVCQSLKA